MKKDVHALRRENALLKRKLSRLFRIQESLEAKLVRLQELQAISRTAGTMYDLDEMLRLVMQSLMGNFGTSAGAVFKYERDSDSPHLVNNLGFDEQEIRATESALKRSKTLPLIHKPVAWKDPLFQKTPTDSLVELRDRGVAVIAPLPIDRTVGGVILLGERLSKERFSREDLGLISMLTANVAIAARAMKLAEEYFQQQAEKYRIKGLLEQFVAPSVVEKLLSGDGDLEIKGDRRAVSVLMADIRDFTVLTERTDAELIMQALNRFYAEMADAVFKYEGTVDKFIGDAVLAVFGAPIGHEDDPQRAVRAALDMVETFDSLAKKDSCFKTVFGKVGLGAGVCTGEVIIGNIGSGKRIDYTVIGRTVNLAARLAAIARKKEVLIDVTTHQKVGENFEMEVLKPTTVKGIGEFVQMWRVIV